MTYEVLASALDSFKAGSTDKSWRMDRTAIRFENEFIRLVRIDSSNHWISATEMEKQWGIIIEQKREFLSLPGCRKLMDYYGMKVTPVRTGKNKGCFGLRFYNMKQDPTSEIVVNVLEFIFN